MDILKNLLTFSALSLFMTSCYTDFEPDIHDDPVLCLNAVIECDKPFSVTVSRTWRYSEGWPSYGFATGGSVDILVRDATLTLFADGKEVEEIVYKEYDPFDPSGNSEFGYLFSYRPHEREELKIVAKSKTYGEASASVVIPRKIEIEKISNNISEVEPYSYSVGYTPDRDNIEGLRIGFNDSFKVTFTDTPGVTNYYRILAEAVNPAKVSSGEYLYDWLGEPEERYYFSKFFFNHLSNDMEPVLSEHLDVFDKMMGASTTWFSVFSDRQIEGKTYSLSLGLEYASIETDNPKELETLYNIGIRIRLMNISESYYNWFIYDWQQSESTVGNLAQIGVGNAVYPYSNVSTGAGIVAAFSESTKVLSYSGLLKEETERFNRREPTE